MHSLNFKLSECRTSRPVHHSIHLTMEFMAATKDPWGGLPRPTRREMADFTRRLATGRDLQEVIARGVFLEAARRRAGKGCTC